MAAAESFAQMGRFLIMAFLMPGAALAAVAFWLFPDVAGTVLDRIPDGVGDGTTALLFFGGFTIFALVSTATPFMIEYLVLRPLGLLPKMDFGKLADLEMAEKNVSQLTQQVGQGIMHYNIAVGVALLAIAYCARAAFSDSTFERYVPAVCILAVASNYYACWKLFDWSKRSLAEAPSDGP